MARAARTPAWVLRDVLAEHGLVVVHDNGHFLRPDDLTAVTVVRIAEGLVRGLRGDVS